MNGIYKFKESQPVVWFHKKLENSNQWCLYCGRFLGGGSNIDSNKEHLIAREFVPKGTMSDTCFNLIFRACSECNTKKSDIERHISSVTLINSPERAENEEIDRIATNKAKKDYHPDHPGKAVIDSTGEQKIQFGDSMSFGFVSPPQLNDEYIKILALRHIQGMFSLLTTKNAIVCEESRLLPPNHLWYFNSFNKQDWGNPQLLSLIERTKDWACHCNIVTADGFFKVIMKRSTHKNNGWFWALEWNKFLRVVGGISLPDKSQEIFQNLPELNWKNAGFQNGANTRFREEIPLKADDELFRAEVISSKDT